MPCATVLLSEPNGHLVPVTHNIVGGVVKVHEIRGFSERDRREEGARQPSVTSCQSQEAKKPKPC